MCCIVFNTRPTVFVSHVVVMVTLALLTYPYISPQQVNNSTIVTIDITMPISIADLSFFQRSAARL